MLHCAPPFLEVFFWIQKADRSWKDLLSLLIVPQLNVNQRELEQQTSLQHRIVFEGLMPNPDLLTYPPSEMSG